MSAAAGLHPNAHIIRVTRPEDRTAVSALWDTCGLSVWYNDHGADMALYDKTPNAELFVAVSPDGRLLATIGCGCDGHRGWIFYLAVDPAHRSGGLGRMMIDHAERYLAGIGAPKVMLMIRESNARLVSYYEGLGYHQDKTLVMAKWLKDLTEEKRTHGRQDGPAELTVSITYLEMRSPPSGPPVQAPSHELHIVEVPKPSVAFFRYLYNTVGEPWLWYEKRLTPDAAIAETLARPTSHLAVAYLAGEPAGFFQLEECEGRTINLTYFGLVPQFIGQGLGRWLLDTALRRAWSFTPNAVTVNTCNLDHPRALDAYREAGFVPVEQVAKRIVDPRLLPSACFRSDSGPK